MPNKVAGKDMNMEIDEKNINSIPKKLQDEGELKHDSCFVAIRQFASSSVRFAVTQPTNAFAILPSAYLKKWGLYQLSLTVQNLERAKSKADADYWFYRRIPQALPTVVRFLPNVAENLTVGDIVHTISVSLTKASSCGQCLGALCHKKGR